MAALADRRHMGCCRTETDQRLVEFARRGDVAAFEAIVLRYQEPLLRHCRRMLTPAEAEDAVQEAFLAAYRSINQTGPELRLGGWLFRIAHNAAVGILRRRVLTASLEGLPLVTESADAVMERRQQLRETLGALSNLPETERVALIERALAGRGHREIAVGLGRSEGAVRQLLHRARTRLRDRVATLVPLFVRFDPRSVGERVTQYPFAVRGGALLAVGLTAVGGGSAVLSAGPPRIGSPFANGEQVSRGAMSAAHPVGVAWFGRPLGDRPAVIGFSERTSSRRGDRTRRRSSITRPSGRPAGRIHRGSTVRVTPIDRGGAPIAAPGRSSANPGTSGTQPVASPGSPGSSTVPSKNQANARPVAPETVSAPGRFGATPGQSGTAPGQSGAAPGQSGAAPGQSGAAPGQSGTTPGQSGTTPGQSGTAPGQSGAAPGQSGTTPGQSGTTPGRVGARSQP